jgi:hypothetical protein
MDGSCYNALLTLLFANIVLYFLPDLETNIMLCWFFFPFQCPPPLPLPAGLYPSHSLSRFPYFMGHRKYVLLSYPTHIHANLLFQVTGCPPIGPR